MRSLVLVTIALALSACGRMNPMNPDYDWTGERWDGGEDTAIDPDTGDTSSPGR